MVIRERERKRGKLGAVWGPMWVERGVPLGRVPGRIVVCPPPPPPLEHTNLSKNYCTSMLFCEDRLYYRMTIRVNKFIGFVLRDLDIYVDQLHVNFHVIAAAAEISASQMGMWAQSQLEAPFARFFFPYAAVFSTTVYSLFCFHKNPCFLESFSRCCVGMNMTESADFQTEVQSNALRRGYRFSTCNTIPIICYPDTSSLWPA